MTRTRAIALFLELPGGEPVGGASSRRDDAERPDRPKPPVAAAGTRKVRR